MHLIEVGPRLSFTSAFSTNAVSICAACGVPVARLERFRRYQLHPEAGCTLSAIDADAFTAMVHDRMTEWRLPAPLTTFVSGAAPVPVTDVPLLAQGKAALEAVNRDMGLGMDAWDIDFYYNLFAQELARDPTDVELFDISQSNSEHSRHWFFRGRIVIDGVEQPRTLMTVVKDTLEAHPDNSVVAFADNSSAIRGFPVQCLVAATPGQPSPLVSAPRLRHCLLTAETHNFPTGVAPYPGAETGTGGRIRDTHATGSGSHVVAGTAAYCVGNLHVPGYPLPWEEGTGFTYPETLAAPLTIEISASNGASDYGNKFGEPVVAGFTRSVGLRLPSGERREYIKPIMFTAGIGAIEEEHLKKGDPEPGMVVVKLGGPAYRIGMGGSAASSMEAGSNKVELDFNAVQRGEEEEEEGRRGWDEVGSVVRGRRGFCEVVSMQCSCAVSYCYCLVVRASRSCIHLCMLREHPCPLPSRAGDAEMEQKVNRVIRACVERGLGNPIVSIHDQGAGGNCNVLKEIVSPAGACKSALLCGAFKCCVVLCRKRPPD